MWQPRIKLSFSTSGGEIGNENHVEQSCDFSGPGEQIIRRIEGMSSREGKISFSYVWLRHVVRAKSFSDTRKENGTVYGTYRETCGRIGLFTDDNECKNALHDFLVFFFAPWTHVYATIVTSCHPT